MPTRRAVAVLLLLAPFVVAMLAGCYTSRPVTADDLLAGNYPQEERLRIVYPTGTVILHDNWRLDYPWAEGRIDEITGTPPAEMVEGQPNLRRFNLEDAQTVAIYDFSPLKVGALTGGGIVVLVAILSALFLATLSCPAVYVDLPNGSEMIGALYPAAMFAKPDAVDYLPVPLPADGDVLRVRIANEHRESQYIDSIALGIVAHPAGTRVVPGEAGPVIVGEALPSRFSGRSPVEAELLSGSDGRPWQNTSVVRRVAEVKIPEGRDVIEATFEAPPGSHALVVRAEQTLFYQAVMRRMIDEEPGSMMQMASRSAADLSEWRADGGIDIRVSLFSEGAWLDAGVVPSAGLEGFREYAVILPPQQGDEVRVRISSAEGFWRLDSITLSPVVDAAPGIVMITPARAVSSGGVDSLDLVRNADSQLLEMHDRGEHLEVEFVGVPNGKALFLVTTGSYSVHPSADGKGTPALEAKATRTR